MSLATILEILPPIDCIVLLKAKPNVTDSNGIMRIVTVSSQIDISVLAQRNMTKTMKTHSDISLTFHKVV